MGLGGESSELLGAVPVARREQRYEVPPKDGAAAMWAPSVSALLEAGWSRLRRSALRGDAPGCVERFTRLSPTGTCTFDAKFSVTPLAERSLVYARANLNASGGGRFVQLTSSLARDLEAGARSAGAAIVWRPFELVSFASSGESGARARPPTLSRECRAHRGAFRHYAAEVAAAGDIYLFAVNPNPALPTTLLALFTVVLGGCAVVALSASRDGARFSAPWPVVRSETFFGGRSFDHPVDGFVRDGDKVHFYVHANVQGITSTPRRGFPPHLARYTMRLDRLARWTLDALETLR